MGSAWTERDIPPLDGTVAVVTGSNSGLGEQAATMLARRGATVVLACRNLDKAEAAAGRMRAAGASGDIELVALDLASLDSVRKAVDEIAALRGRLDLLVNNAGLMAVDEARTADGFEMQIGVNHLGHFALTAGLAPVLLATAGSRVVNVSSMGHRAGRLVLDDLMFERRRYQRWLAYTQSKLANLLFTLELHRRLTAAGAPTSALAAHPGLSRTDLGTEGSGILNRATKYFTPAFGQSAYTGALPIVRAATDLGAESGQLYGPNLVVRGHPVVETPSRAARNRADAEALWRRSEELTGVTFPIG
jgi:protochlorophyllide reductase